LVKGRNLPLLAVTGSDKQYVKVVKPRFSEITITLTDEYNNPIGGTVEKIYTSLHFKQVD
jgi:hypothetical protein